MNPLLEQLKERIRSKISELNFNTWFRPIIDASEEGDLFTLKVVNKFIADWINDYYLDLIKQELFHIRQKGFDIRYKIVAEEDVAPVVESIELPITQLPVPESRAKSIGSLNHTFTFDRFIVGGSNQFAQAACKAVADLPGGRYNPLFIYGGVGLGKTHLLHAIGLEVQERRPEVQVIYVSAERFMNELINALRYQRMPAFRKKYRDSCDILLIDDVQFIGGKERTQEEFFHTFDTLHSSHRQIVVTSDKLPKDIPGIEERLRTRFEWGLIADIGAPDLETRIAILKKKGEMLGLDCPDNVAMFLASSIKTNIRELEGSLIRINAFASLTGSKLSVELAREILGKSINEQEQRCSIESIQKTVASYYNINLADLKSPRRVRNFSYPRQIAMYLCKKHVRTSFPEIGGKFGGKDHTTVLHACRKIEKLLETDDGLRVDLAHLEKTLLH